MFYDNYLRLCNKKGISASAAALDMGLSKAAVTGWAQGKVPRDATLRRIADYFGVTVEELKSDSALQKNKKPPEISINGDDELTGYLEQLATRPEMRMLFSVTKDASKADVEVAVRIIEALRKQEDGKG